MLLHEESQEAALHVSFFFPFSLCLLLATEVRSCLEGEGAQGRAGAAASITPAWVVHKQQVPSAAQQENIQIFLLETGLIAAFTTHGTGPPRNAHFRC